MKVQAKRKPRGSGIAGPIRRPDARGQRQGRGTRQQGHRRVTQGDRAAIFPSGHFADAAYWFAGGQFVTSTYYTDVLPPWVRQFNLSKFADRWYGSNWERFRPDLDYDAIAGPNKKSGTPLQSRTINGGKPTFTSSYYDALAASPFGNEHAPRIRRAVHRCRATRPA